MSGGPGLLPARPTSPPRWPFRPKPKDDELLSSYLCRIAGGMHLKPITLLTAVFGSERSLLGQDLDNYAPAHVVDAVAHGIGIDRAAVEATTLRGYDGWLLPSHGVRGRKVWIMPTDAKSNDRRRHGLQFCPACLASDAVPYLRRSWRLAFATVCTTHGCNLLEGCPACGAVLHPHRSPSIRHCYRCGASLGVTPAAADPELAAWQRDLEDTLTRGGGPLGRDLIWSPALFAVVRQVAALLVNGPRAAALRAAAAEAHGGDPEPFGKALRRQPVEYLGVDDRRRLFDLVRRLLADWPSRFVAACSTAGLFRSHAIKDMPDVPFAFERVLREHLDRTPYQATETEVAAAASWLRRTEGRATYKDLKAICGESRVAIYRHMDYVRRPSTPSRYRRCDPHQSSESPSDAVHGRGGAHDSRPGRVRAHPASSSPTGASMNAATTP